MTVCGIVLAAGAGTRFGGPKAPYEWDGQRLVDRAVGTLRAAGCDPVYTILGAWEGQVEDCLVIVNHGWEEGMGSSLRIGLKWARAASDAESAVVILVDQPGITPDGVLRVIETPGTLVQAVYGDRPGHPVRIGKDHWQPLIDTVADDSGARDYLAAHERLLVDVSDVCDDTDLDYRSG
jgi:CTP:molybdopterin cytidylyltransferase MocA